jgi:RHS repeat-associated protein
LARLPNGIGVGVGLRRDRRLQWGQAVDQLLADEDVNSLSSPGSLLWPLTDHLGTVRDWINNSATILDHVEYDSFGKRADTTVAVDAAFGWTGRYRDALTGLQYNHARWYDPKIGRWLSEDPIGFEGGDANLSRYVENTPTTYIDSDGLTADDPWWNDSGWDLINPWTYPGPRHAINFFVGYVPPPQSAAPPAGGGPPTAGQDGMRRGAFGGPAGGDACDALAEGRQMAGQLLRDTATDAAIEIGTLGAGAIIGRVDDVNDLRKAKRAKDALDAMERHHNLPHQFLSNFRNAGLKIEDYVEDLSKCQHRLKPDGLHTGPNNWNKLWRQFFERYPNAKSNQILEELDRIRKIHGLPSWRRK